MSLYNPYRTRKVQGLCKSNWNRRAYLKGPLSSYLNKEVEKENPNPRKLHKIFNVGAREFAWLQNLKVYKKRNKNSFFCRRRLGFQKENLMKLSRVTVFFPHLFI